MIYRFQLILFFVLIIGFQSCSYKKDGGETKSLNLDQVNEKLLKANKVAIEFERKQIDKLIDSSGWNMQVTATGLRYEIIENGNGTKAETGKLARFEYETKLITGKIVYSSALTGPKEFRIGSGGVESGLEEGILLLQAGDKARFVIPSFLAHGLSGDQDKIPPKATLIYTIKLIELE
ncbi:MAG: FKBP-type peptidyl-prolyl cis-trans isomerase [Bacteroidales bacterium]|nr:FKBP-type peptidyl-prolyl cis-trans isomerase [Bacteroidales bacterium]